MSIRILQSGVQTSVQALPRSGFRHLGIPDAGAADSLSLALANRLVSKPSGDPAIEITFGNVSFLFEEDLSVAITGANVKARLNNETVSLHKTFSVSAGDQLDIGGTALGVRSYVALSGQLVAESFLGTASTYIEAGIGGFHGRCLKDGDSLDLDHIYRTDSLSTPLDILPIMSNSWALRASTGPDFEANFRAHLFNRPFELSRRGSRVGLELLGSFPKVPTDGARPSSSVFPGTLQFTPGGTGFLLLCEAQTTGGYPHLLQVNRSDRHILGQLRPGDSVQFLHRTPEAAALDLRAKRALFEAWLPDFEF